MLCLEQNAVDGMNIHGWVTLVRTAGKEEGPCPIWAKPNREPACKRNAVFRVLTQHHRVDYTGMIREMRDPKLIRVAVIFELLHIIPQCHGHDTCLLNIC